MDDEHWVPTGTRSRIRRDTNRVPAFIGDHLWTWVAIFRAAPCTEQPMLDSENLLRITGIVCHYCRQEYRRGTVPRHMCAGPIE
jgi:hypothetical protein